MKIAVTYQDGEVFQHFGHCAQFKLYEVEDGKILFSDVVGAMGSGHSALAGMMLALRVKAVICGGIGSGAKKALEAYGIAVYGGIQGSADAAAQALAEGTLQYDPNPTCEHHDDEEEHVCGAHGCGNCGGCGGCGH